MAHNESHTHHVAPLSQFYKTFGALVVLTVVTVVTSYMDFGVLNIAIALGIASLKATLVALFFMQLKGDKIENKVSLVTSVLFVILFLGITATDPLFRRAEQPITVAAIATSAGDQNKLRLPTPEAIAKGKTLFTNNCVPCHGEKGMGDGIAAAALNPKPRNFHVIEGWKNGRAPTQMFKTLTQGIPNSGMAPFPGIPVADRYAIIHYIRATFMQNPPDDNAETLKAAGLAGGGTGVQDKPTVQVELAMANMEAQDQILLPEDSIPQPNHPGAKIYANDCAQCHGANGHGAPLPSTGVNPAFSLITKNWAETKGTWLSNENEFIKIVSEGLPGKNKPGITKYSKAEWAELHNYVKVLAGQK